jgi:hypothetical protein
MKKWKWFLVFCWGLTTLALGADRAMSIKGFHAGMSDEEYHQLINKYSWSGVDRRTVKTPGAPAFTLAGVIIPDSPQVGSYGGQPDGTGASMITFVIPEKAMGPLSQALLNKYSSADCGWLTDNGRKHYECKIEWDRVQIWLGEVTVKPAGSSEYHHEYQLKISSFDALEHLNPDHADRYRSRPPPNDL